MKIQEFIEDRTVSYDTVRKYISRNPDLFKGHIGKSNNIVLDEVAVRLLDAKYPRPAPVQVIQDTSARNRLQELQDKYIELLEENKRLTQENANLLLQEHKQFLLEEENNRLQKKIDDNKEKIIWQGKMIETQNRQMKELIEKLEEEKAKPWWKKLRGR